MVKLIDRPAPWGMRYSARELADRTWRKHIVWLVLKAIPRPVKYYVVVQLAVKDNEGNPGERTAVEMLKILERKERHATQDSEKKAPMGQERSSDHVPLLLGDLPAGQPRISPVGGVSRGQGSTSAIDWCSCGATKLNEMSVGRHIMGTSHTRDGCGLVEGTSYGEQEGHIHQAQESGQAAQDDQDQERKQDTGQQAQEDEEQQEPKDT